MSLARQRAVSPTGRGMPAGHGGFFIENLGQVGDDELHLYSQGPVAAGFSRSAVLLKLLETVTDSETKRRRGVLLRLSFLRGRQVEPEGRVELAHRSHYFRGSDPTRWRTGARSYDQVIYRDVYGGIDAIYRSTKRGLKYEFHVAPGADPAWIRIGCEGNEDLRIEDGELVMGTALGELRDASPRAYQDEDDVYCGYALRAPRVFGFDCRGWDRTRPLVIDPLVYSTFLGGGGQDRSRAIVVDGFGNAYVTGQTDSTEFPTTPGAFDETYNASPDVFVTKLTADGSGLGYSTYLGSDGTDNAAGIEVDSDGNAYVTGNADATFPTTPGAFSETSSGLWDAFVAKLTPDGSGLAYSTFLGGGTTDIGRGIAVGADGTAYVTGNTLSSDFPTTPGALQESHGGEDDGFVVKLDADGATLVYATYLGGGGRDLAYDVAVDGSGSAYVPGYTASTDFPTTLGAYAETFAGGAWDGFAAKVAPDGGSLDYSTFLGGTDWEEAHRVAIDAAGHAYVTGSTVSTDFPTTPGALLELSAGGWDAFVAKLTAGGDGLMYSTYLGGSLTDNGEGIDVDANGSAYVTGNTTSVDFPTSAGAYDDTPNGSADAFVAKLDVEGTSLLYGTYLGGGSSDYGSDIASSGSCDVIVAAWTGSVDFPTTPGAFDESANGGNDVAVTRLDPGCGDGCCSPGEDNATCPEDCGTCPDAVCGADETCVTCPDDCNTCGDGCCIAPEDVTSCAQDCSVCPDGMCTGPETCVTCPDDCNTCGDGCCLAPEDCGACTDCACTPPELCVAGACTLPPDMGTPEPAMEPVADAAAEPALDMASGADLGSEPAPEPPPEPAPEPPPEPAPEPPLEPAPEPPLEPAPDLGPEPTPEPVADAPTEPTPEPVADAPTEPTPEPGPDVRAERAMDGPIDGGNPATDANLNLDVEDPRNLLACNCQLGGARPIRGSTPAPELLAFLGILLLLGRCNRWRD